MGQGGPHLICVLAWRVKVVWLSPARISAQRFARPRRISRTGRWLRNMTIEFGHLVVSVLIPGMAYACWRDLRSNRIPNWLNAALVLSGLFVHGWLSGWTGIQQSFLGLLTGFSLLIVLWLMRAMGAGDVKYMAALGAWLGPEMTLYAALAGILVGGVISLGMVAYRRAWGRFANNMGLLVIKMGSARTAFGEFASMKDLTGPGKTAVPYAVPLTLGALGVLLMAQTGLKGF